MSRDVLFDESKWWTCDANPQPDTVMIKLSDDQANVHDQRPAIVLNSRPQRTRQVPQRLQDYKVWHEHEVIADGDLTHLAFLTKLEPMKFEDVIKDVKWLHAMEEELHSIEKKIELGSWLIHQRDGIFINWTSNQHF